VKAFETLNKALDLAEAGRLNAARSVWKDLPEIFRQKVMKFTIFAFQNQHELGCICQMTSPYGDFELSDTWVARLKQHLPGMADESS
jgi:hypothetical protein